jgi:hypothetical protein
MQIAGRPVGDASSLRKFLYSWEFQISVKGRWKTFPKFIRAGSDPFSQHGVTKRSAVM